MWGKASTWSYAPAGLPTRERSGRSLAVPSGERGDFQRITDAPGTEHRSEPMRMDAQAGHPYPCNTFDEPLGCQPEFRTG